MREQVAQRAAGFVRASELQWRRARPTCGDGPHLSSFAWVFQTRKSQFRPGAAELGPRPDGIRLCVGRPDGIRICVGPSDTQVKIPSRGGRTWAEARRNYPLRGSFSHPSPNPVPERPTPGRGRTGFAFAWAGRTGFAFAWDLQTRKSRSRPGTAELGSRPDEIFLCVGPSATQVQISVRGGRRWAVGPRRPSQGARHWAAARRYSAESRMTGNASLDSAERSQPVAAMASRRSGEHHRRGRACQNRPHRPE